MTLTSSFDRLFWTLAAYAVEGKNSVNYSLIKSMAFREPALLHQLLKSLSEAIAL